MIEICRQAFSVKKQIKFLLILLIAVFLTLSCQEKRPTEPEENGNTNPDIQLIVDKYILPAGETAEFPSGFEIIANNGVDIQGDILIKPIREGDFTIRCLGGDMILNGKISVDTTIKRSTAKVSPSGLSKVSEVDQSTNFNFILEGLGNAIKLDREFQAKPENGLDADEEIVHSSGDGMYTGTKGGNGGYIVINAINGYIFIDRREEGDPPMFVLGNGGNGANVIVDNKNFNTTALKLDIFGGDGGESGFLEMNADSIFGLNFLQSKMVTGGEGGKGGDVWWDVSGLLSGNSTEDKRFPLMEINFRGGNGGNGAIEGGKGGYAAYWSYRVINELNEPIASVSVTGGNGGNVKANFLTARQLKPVITVMHIPIENAFGGLGGEYVVLGNMGWDGVHPDDGEPINGANGGNVTGKGGNGGSVEEGVMFLKEAIGGSGGNSLISQYTIPALFNFSNTNDFKALNYGVIAGSGGKGASICEGCPGGNAGNAGIATANGGNGGNVPNRPGGKGGKGGDAWTVASIQLSGASGGDGNEPGNGGCAGTVTIIPGKGGNGYEIGEDGLYLGNPEGDTPCSPDGNPCGEGLFKRSDLCEDDCDGFEGWFRSLYSSNSETFDKDDILFSSNFHSSTIEGYITGYNQTTERYFWTIQSAITEYEVIIIDGEPRVIKDTTRYYTIQEETTSRDYGGPGSAPECIGTGENSQNYVPYIPGSGPQSFSATNFMYHPVTSNYEGKNIYTITKEYSGCPAEDYNISDWRCCNGSGITNTGGEECP